MADRESDLTWEYGKPKLVRRVVGQLLAGETHLAHCCNTGLTEQLWLTSMVLWSWCCNLKNSYW